MRPATVLIALSVAACRAHPPGAADAALGDAVAARDNVAAVDAGTATLADSAGDAPPAAACPAAGTLEARAREARDRYGAGVRTAVVLATFLFVDPDNGPLFAEATRFAARVLGAYRNDRFGVVPLCPVSVYVFASHARFIAHSAWRHYPLDSGGNVGLYDPERGEIVADVSSGRAHLPTIAHELSHPLMDADFAGAPRWFKECVGTLFEAPVLPADGEIHGVANWRYGQLRASIAAGDPDAHLSALFGMNNAAFRAKTDAGVDATRQLLHYATARAACQWLDERQKLWPFYRAWRDAFGDDPDGRATFTRITGEAPAGADARWRAWVMRPE